MFPNNLQGSYESKLGHTDSSYTAAVDNGTYTNFVNDSAGYGLAQWTYSTRKKKLLDYAKSKNVSISDLNMQLEFLVWELNNESEYSSVLNVLKTTNSIQEASNKVLFDYEAPKNQGSTVQADRARWGQGYYDQFINGIYDNTNQNVPQINIIQKTSTHNTSSSPNRTLKYIVIHYTAGTTSRTGSAENTANYFATTDREASADFIVDDTTIVQYNPDIRNRRTWHCGGGKQSAYGGTYYQICTNTNSIGIEVCSTSSSGSVVDANDSRWYFTDAVIQQTVLLTKYLMATYNIGVDCVIRHYDVTGKWCPGIIGWNSASGDESKWLAFKNQLVQNTFTDASGNPSAYAVRTTTTANIYKEPSLESEIVKTYEKNTVLAIANEQDGFGYMGSGWIELTKIRRVSVSEAIIEYILNGYDKLVYNPETGKVSYSLEDWDNFSNGGFKFLAHDDLLDLLFAIRAKETEGRVDSIKNNEFAKRILIGLDGSWENKEQCAEKIRLVLKSAASSNKSLVPSSPKILVKTAANAFTEVSEEHILEKLEKEKYSIIEYFQNIYDENGWNKNIKTAPETLNFWFDFMETEGEMGKYAARAIGNRPKAVNNDKVTAIYFQETPSVLFLTPEQHSELLDSPEDFMDMTGYTFVKLQPFMENYFTISGQGKSAKDELDSLLYQHTYAAETTTLTAVPIYHLQPNTRVFIKDSNTGINGEYIVSKVTVPLQYNGTSSITTTKAVERIY